MFLGRPQILILPLAVAWTASVFRAAERKAAPPPLLLAILVAWANLHGSFLLGVLIAGFAFCHYLEIAGFRQRTVLLRWLGFLAASVLAGFINPYGIQPFVLAVKMSSSNEWIPMISEWLPFNAKDQPIHEASLLACFAVLLWARPKLSLSKIAFVLFALHMFLLHQRFIFVPALFGAACHHKRLDPAGSPVCRTPRGRNSPATTSRALRQSVSISPSSVLQPRQ